MKCHIHELADGKVKVGPNGPNRSLLGHFIWKMDENGKVTMGGWGWLGPIFKSCIRQATEMVPIPGQAPCSVWQSAKPCL